MLINTLYEVLLVGFIAFLVAATAVEFYDIGLPPLAWDFLHAGTGLTALGLIIIIGTMEVLA